MNRLVLTLAASACALAMAGAASAQPAEVSPQMPQLPPIPPQPAAGSKYQVYPVRNGVFMITTPTGNVTVQTGVNAVLVVDTGTKEDAPALLDEIRKISRKPIMWVLNTGGDPDHIGGNQAISASGVLLEGGNTRPKVVPGSDGAPILAHEGVLNRLVASGGEPVGWPTSTYFVEQKDMFFNGEPISLIHAPAAHTSADSFVMFRRSDVISAGDAYSPDRYPQIDLENGGSIQGVLDGLNHLIRLTIPEFNQQGGTFVVPGHGRLSDEADVADYRDMVTFIRDRVRDMVKKKMTLAQIKVARPTLDYDPLYGTEAGDAFVDQIYRSLTQKKSSGEGAKP